MEPGALFNGTLLK